MSVEEIFRKIDCRLDYARDKHPEGTTFEDLTDEFLEAWQENRAGNIKRTEDEILDLIVTGIRILLKGDIQNA